MIMLENTWYSVITPEGCAAILWRDSGKSDEAADAMKVTAADLYDMGIADEILKEPIGGAHRNYDETAQILKTNIIRHLNELIQIPVTELIENRIEKYRKMGHWSES
jgi:acetyl-CoA carboxylase carboxyl transferase subunit alpha